jgi:hypothetical protein
MSADDNNAPRPGRERRRAVRFVARCRARAWVANRWLDVPVVNLSRSGIWVTGLPRPGELQPVTLLLSPLDGRYQVAVRGDVLRVDDAGARIQFAEGQSDIGPWIRRMIRAQILPQIDAHLGKPNVDPETLAEALAWDRELRVESPPRPSRPTPMELTSEEVAAIDHFRQSLTRLLGRVDPALQSLAATLATAVDDDLDFDIDIVDELAKPSAV